jgi:SNF2 family DNA or RNA helicase
MIYILKKLRQYEAEDAQAIKEIRARKKEFQMETDKAEEKKEPDTRTIILSQFVAALELMDRYLTENGIMSVRFQGSTSAEERRQAINMLTNGGVKVMLLSTKAGGGVFLSSFPRLAYLSSFSV